jgi:hypothetical protein
MRSKAKSRGIILIQNLIRSFMAKRRANRVRITYPSVVYVSIVKTEGLSLSNTSVDPSAYVSGVFLNLPIDHAAKTHPNVTITDELIKQNSRVSSHYKIDAINANPKTQAMVTGLTNLDFVAVTIVEKTDCVGQVKSFAFGLSFSFVNILLSLGFSENVRYPTTDQQFHPQTKNFPDHSPNLLSFGCRSGRKEGKPRQCS